MVQAWSTVGCGDALMTALDPAAGAGLAALEIPRIAAARGPGNTLAHSPGAVPAHDIRIFRRELHVERLLQIERSVTCTPGMTVSKLKKRNKKIDSKEIQAKFLIPNTHA
jgi:hypothetical protein